MTHMIGVEQADQFFQSEDRMSSDRSLAELFRSSRSAWRDNTALFGYSPLVHFVDHGWGHAERLYCCMPGFISILENKLSNPLLQNAGEWFSLVCAAYLHDIGMGCQIREAAEFCRDIVRKSFSASLLSEEAKAICRKRCPDADNLPGEPLDALDIRKLHADIGAWRIRKGRPSIIVFSPAANVVAWVIQLHRKTADKTKATPQILNIEGHEHLVRVGLIAALIAVFDSCMVGYEWIESESNVEAQAYFRQEAFAQTELALAGARQNGDSVAILRCENTLNSLKQQDEHFLKHWAVRKVHFLSKDIIIEPVKAVPDTTWFEERCSILTSGANLMLGQTGELSIAELLKKAWQDIHDEIDGPLGVRSFIATQVGRNILPKTRRTDAQSWGKLQKKIKEARYLLTPPRPGPLLLSKRPPGYCKPTVVFGDVVDLVILALRRNKLVVLVAPTGVGKTSVAAALFRNMNMRNTQLVWFEGCDIEALLTAIGEQPLQNRSQRLCVVLDEEHQQHRDESFFCNLFRQGAYQAIMARGHSILLAVRTSTHKTLSQSRFLTYAEIITMNSRAARLENYKAWGMNRPFTKPECDLILKQASDPQGNLNSFIVDYVYVRALCRTGKLTEGDFRSATIYDRLIASRNERDQKVMQAIFWAGRIGRIVPLWLIIAVMRAMDCFQSIEELQERLKALEDDLLVVRSTENLGWHVNLWRFAHDLINESVDDYTRHHSSAKISVNKIVEAGVELQRNITFSEGSAFREGLALWVALAVAKVEGAERVITALSDIELLLPTEEKIKMHVVESVCNVANYIGTVLPTYEDINGSTLFIGMYELGEIVARNITSAHTRDICRKSIQVVSLAYMLSISGIASGELDPEPMWEMHAHKLRFLKTIGEICTRNTFIYNNLYNSVERIRFAQLLMWADRWGEAARIIEKTIWTSIGEGVNDLYPLSRIDLAVRAYLKAGDKQNAHRVYERIAKSLERAPGMRHMIKALQENAEIAAHWLTDEEPRDWLELIAERRLRITELLQSSQQRHIAIISTCGEIAIASLIADGVENRGIPPIFIYAESLRDLEEIPSSWGVIFLGGQKVWDIDRLIKPLARQLYNDMILMEDNGPAYGNLSFTARERYCVWLAGLYSWTTELAAKNWLNTGGIEKFIDRVKRSRLSNSFP